MRLTHRLSLPIEQFAELSGLLRDVSQEALDSPSVNPTEERSTMEVPAKRIRETVGKVGLRASFIRNSDLTGDMPISEALIHMQHPELSQMILHYRHNAGGLWAAEINGRENTLTTQDVANLTIPNFLDPGTLSPLMDRPVADDDPEDFLFRLYISAKQFSNKTVEDLSYKVAETTNAHPTTYSDRVIRLYQRIKDGKINRSSLSVDGLFNTRHGDVLKHLDYTVFSGPKIRFEGGTGAIELKSKKAPKDILEELMRHERINQEGHFMSLLSAMNSLREHIRRSDRSLLGPSLRQP